LEWNSQLANVSWCQRERRHHITACDVYRYFAGRAC